MAGGRKPGRRKVDLALKLVKENSVMSAVQQFLALRGIPHWRINSGGLQDAHGRMVRFGAKGMSDFYAIGPSGISIWIECKRPVGGRLSEAQKEFLDTVNRSGGIGIVVNSVESLEQQLKGEGVI
ncbi:MAG: VRR-NUC domain-containing protein [Treponema sp.]|jgi:hypothetical protein|nr:VRR-NUC domain-containing protein [Treponema sp.]